MPKKRISNSRKELLVRLESIIGSQCYSTNMQNWGPGGTFEGEGREFRYPIRLRDADGNSRRLWRIDPKEAPGETLLSGYYAFGANQLHIMQGLSLALDYLEQQYGPKINPSAKRDPQSL